MITVRHPREVAASLEATHRLVPMHGLLSWATHMVAAERGTAAWPRHRVRFDRLLADPAGVLAELTAFAPGLGETEAAVASVRGGLRHQHADETPWPAALAPLEALHAHLNASADGQPGDPMAVDMAAAWLDSLREIVAPLLAECVRDCVAALT